VFPSFRFPHQNPTCISLLPHTCRLFQYTKKITREIFCFLWEQETIVCVYIYIYIYIYI
jgi:hypothetical protein